MPILSSYDIAATDCAAAFVMVSVFGLMFLMAATDGGSVHGFGLLGTVNPRGRIIALIGSNVIFAFAAVICWIGRGITPLGLAHGARIWWHSGGIDLYGYIVAVFTYWVLLSPLQSLLAIYFIRRAVHKERKRLTLRRKCTTLTSSPAG